MSWKGFTKAIVRLPHKIKSKAGYTEETVDEEFDHLEISYRELVALATKLADDSAKYVRSISDLLDHGETSGQIFNDIYNGFPANQESTSLSPDGGNPTSPRKRSSGEVKNKYAVDLIECYSSLKKEIIPELNRLQITVVQPSQELLQLFKNVDKWITKRNHKKVDYDRFRETVKKMEATVDKTSGDYRKLASVQESLRDAVSQYDRLNKELKDNLPILLHLRINFINPCLQILFYFQNKFYSLMNTYFDPFANVSSYQPGPIADQYEKRYNELLASIGELKLISKNIAPTLPSASSQDAPPNYEQAAGVNVSPGFPSEKKSPVSPPAASTSSISPLRVAPVVNPPPVGIKPQQPPPPPSNKPVQMVTAIYDYQAQAKGDLSFRKGDRIELIQRTVDQNDWWKGRLNGAEGVFPGTYVTLE